jgi:type I restriction enzyme, S subunit
MEVREPSAKYLARPGYKQTDVGLIPEDWNVLSAYDACSKIQDGTHFSPRIKGNDYFYVTSKNIRFGYLDLSTASRIDAEQHQEIYRRCDVRKGDLLLTKDGANTGNVALNTLDEEFSLLSSVAFLRFHENKHCAAFFLQQILTSQGQRQIQDAMAGNAITRLTLEKINKLRFSAPPTKVEQEAIAEVLSDADALIESLEQLLAKKRHLKQGAMQELLTGKKRLPGFGDEWTVTQLSTLGSTFGGLVGKVKGDFGQGDAKYITFMNIMTNVVIDCGAFEFVNVKPVESQNRVVKGDLFFNGSSETPEEVGMCSVLMQEVQDVFLNSFCFGFRFRDGVRANGLYFAYYFRSQEGSELLKSLAQGATRYNLSKTALLRVSFPLPSFDEQIAISSVLSDMDTEIAALEDRLAKARSLKQGMMQELLTGRIRLV